MSNDLKANALGYRGVESDVVPRRRPTVTIRPTHGWTLPDLTELWNYRDLLFILGFRDVKLRYKQTVLGVIWVVLQPLIPALMFAVIFGRFAKLPSNGDPYILFAYAGLLPWNFFAGALTRAGGSLLTDKNLISKIYFPRLIIPIASTFAVGIDFLVALVVFAPFLLIFHISLTWHVVALPFFLLMTVIAALGFSLLIAGINVKYRDFGYALPYVVQVWMLASPVAYTARLVPRSLEWLYALNPAVGLIEGFRWSVLGKGNVNVETLVPMCVVSVAVFVAGTLFFRRLERGFADFV